MSAFLDAMAHRSRERAKAAARQRAVRQVGESSPSSTPPRSLGTFGASFDLIAEIKPRSPVEGEFPDHDPVATAAAYQSGGAGMVSVLTEPTSFGGSLDTLRRVRAAVDIPVLAKDFLVDPVQVHEARDAGADGVLLIARILSDETLLLMIDVAEQGGMFTLLEAFDERDLTRVIAAAEGRSGTLIGVNCRDLETLDVLPERHGQLAAQLPSGRITVAESAISNVEDVERVAGLGYRAALVGSALMRSEAPEGLVRLMVETGRRAVAVPT